MSRRQHSKGKKRPRGWHRGRAQGKVNDRKLQEAEPHFNRADETANNSHLLDDMEVWAALEHVNPTVPCFYPS